MSNVQIRTHLSRPKRIHDNLESKLSDNPFPLYVPLGQNGGGDVDGFWNIQGMGTPITSTTFRFVVPNPLLALLWFFNRGQTGVGPFTDVGTVTMDVLDSTGAVLPIAGSTNSLVVDDVNPVSGLLRYDFASPLPANTAFTIRINSTAGAGISTDHRTFLYGQV